MDRREFLKNSALVSAGMAIAPSALASASKGRPAPVQDGKLIISAPMLQNYAENSMGVAFAVSDMANGYVIYGRTPDLSDGVKVKCGGFRVTDINDKVMLVRLTGLEPATKYYYRIGADRISYKGGYNMHITGNEEDSTIYSFTTAGAGAVAHFCVINDTHAHMDTFDRLTLKLKEIDPSCVVWNGDATNCEETIDSQVGIFLTPDIRTKDYAARTPYLFGTGNHDNRGMANRHNDRVWMFRQPEERLSRDWDLGRNFAVRMGEVAMIGLDTAEDKMDTNPLFAGLFNSQRYREAQAVWLEDALKQPEIASAPFLVAFCHIPIFDTDPTHNPGDVAPADKDPRYSSDFAYWQRFCGSLWGPLLDRAGCQTVITAHMHEYRYDEPGEGRCWSQIVGGGCDLGRPASQDGPTIIEGKVEDGKLHILVHDITTGKIHEEFTYLPRKNTSRRRKR